MKNDFRKFLIVKKLFFVICVLVSSKLAAYDNQQSDNPLVSSRKLAYLVSDIRIPFWQVLAKGIRQRAEKLGYEVEVYSAENDARQELVSTVEAIRQQVAGIIVSPTNSSACVTVLKLARKAQIPVVVVDIGSDSGEFVSYISSDNFTGAYEIGKVLAAKMIEKGWREGRVGVIAIPQKRENGQARTAGFMKAMDEAGIKGAGIKQQVDFSYDETYRYSNEIINAYPDLRAIWLQGSNRYQAALDAIADAGKKNQMLLITFDAEPDFLKLIPQGVILGAAMQQPYLMGEEAVEILDNHLQGKPVKRIKKLPVLAISAANIVEKTEHIKRNVLGLISDERNK